MFLRLIRTSSVEHSSLGIMCSRFQGAMGRPIRRLSLPASMIQRIAGLAVQR